MAYQLPRRTFLKAAGVSIALPALESMAPAVTRSNTASQAPRRLVCVGNEFGMYPGSFWPKSTGRDYEVTPLLEPLAAHRSDLTLFSNLDHGLKGGHFAIHGFLTGVNAADAKGMEEGGISLDQKAAEAVGSATRFPSLNVGSEDGLHGGCQMSWTRTGTRIPPMPGPRELFRSLFINDDGQTKAQAKDRIRLQNSILDSVLDDANSLSRRISRTDKQKLDEYFASIRDVESKLALDQYWQDIPKPEAPFDEPENEGLTKDLPKIYDLLAIALQTDSTRVATIEVGGSFAASDLGIRSGYHSLSHHGHVDDKIDELVQIERYQVEQFARFLDTLKGIREPGEDGTLLDSTMALFGSGMGNANSHTNHNLPIILAGGGFQHGEYKSYPDESSKKVPLSNLFLSMLQQFGIETNNFSMSTGTLSGLETA
ncbi:hypothetical protein KOR42_27910 [Thalassoglobus neptunius]|uniref:DUF1552 domain-containing protein n=1 Tax=Thalassoglobus neptunius TaxID=1938619 RepID=A0A5C5WZQ6_9PLAN|nr:DUF1552 domain-containing protein [Thalassoglobus neptunius]TWT55405.1 hypothetical protein KOR42_27910 [Thalassoglobus neptunius]